ncbi:hepatic leukemia factor-like [Mercenaria mercenaria]|uniref:hepatic leukemia factor-like n=1 Tax=Mercenaria mercenaria TaxID=6596 RepID=UPI00234F0697|nr:hepatic leukemia factor-like [Mercenaria mercenaria]
MADGTFCEYTGQMDNALMSQMSGYGGRGSSENLGDGHSQQSKAGPGFYTEQFPSSMSSAMMESLVMSSMASGNHSNQEALIASMMSQAAAASSAYESAVNFALKPEKGLPPTPPGSPNDPKGIQANSTQHAGYHSNMHPASMVGMPSSFNHNLLAKPVPMRRLSEKRIAQARASIGGVSSEPPGMIEHETLPDPVTNPTLARALAAVNQGQKRPRSEKKAIPDDAKDDKYFERRKRNNNAAKKSRDARKAREDEIAIRASFLEKENAILRAQVTTLREEANSLRQLLLQKRASRH